MSALNKLRQKQGALKKLQQELAALENSAAVRAEQAFMNDLDALMRKYSKSTSDILEALGVSNAKNRMPRKMRTFRNPATGETLEAKSTNNKTLKQWAAASGVSVDKLEVK